MSAYIGLQARVDDYLSERRRFGFQLRSLDTLLADFAKYVADRHHHGPLTVELMADWVRTGKGGLGTPETWFRRMAVLRRFIRYLQQFEPQTEMPEALIFGPEPRRMAPHIYAEEEIVELLAAARQLGPRGSLRPATFETLFGLMASTGLRVSEAIHLQDADVDLKSGILIVRQTKFAKSRQLPLHTSTLEALARYRRQRKRHVPTTANIPFFMGTRGKWLGEPLGDRQVHRVFNTLRDSLDWVNRGAHAAPRLHDLRHTFAVRRLMRWHSEGADVDQMMLALSTYLGHTKISCTYWYLSAVPELMALAGGKFEHFADLAGADDE
ncbi:MAG: tyrosine-type recombinase/integrase [Chromatiaceae bacterium]|nr:tyrosine-type recombinase/integrase [Chromatiaceae bacterium]